MSKVHDVILDYIIWLQGAALRKGARGEFAKESLDKLKELIAEHDPEWRGKIHFQGDAKDA